VHCSADGCRCNIDVRVVGDSTCAFIPIAVLQAELARNEEQQKQFTERLQHERTKLTGVLNTKLQPVHVCVTACVLLVSSSSSVSKARALGLILAPCADTVSAQKAVSMH
jgi:hypothetical protein